MKDHKRSQGKGGSLKWTKKGSQDFLIIPWIKKKLSWNAAVYVSLYCMVIILFNVEMKKWRFWFKLNSFKSVQPSKTNTLFEIRRWTVLKHSIVDIYEPESSKFYIEGKLSNFYHCKIKGCILHTLLFVLAHFYVFEQWVYIFITKWDSLHPYAVPEF